MGHGDELALVDRNFPAQSVAKSTSSGQLVQLPASHNADAAGAICSVLPIDDFVDEPIRFMAVVGEPDQVLPVHLEMQTIASRAEGREVSISPLERHAFYEAARKSFAVVQTAEVRPYACFLIGKGVIKN